MSVSNTNIEPVNKYCVWQYITLTCLPGEMIYT